MIVLISILCVLLLCFGFVISKLLTEKKYLLSENEKLNRDIENLLLYIFTIENKINK